MKNKKSNVKKEMLNTLRLLNEINFFTTLGQKIDSYIDPLIRSFENSGTVYIYVSDDVYRALKRLVDSEELGVDKIVRITIRLMSILKSENPHLIFNRYNTQPHHRNKIPNLPDKVYTTLSEYEFTGRLSAYLMNPTRGQLVSDGIISTADIKKVEPSTPPVKPAAPSIPLKPVFTPVKKTPAPKPAVTPGTPDASAKPAGTPDASDTTSDNQGTLNIFMKQLTTAEDWAKAHQGSLIGAGAGAGITAAGWAAARAYLQRQLKNCETEKCRKDIKAKISKLNKLALISGIGLTALGAAAQPLSTAAVQGVKNIFAGNKK